MASVLLLIAAARTLKVQTSLYILAIPITIAVGLFIDSILVSLYPGGFQSLVNSPSRERAFSIGTLAFLVSLVGSGVLTGKMLGLKSKWITILPGTLLVVLIGVAMLISILS